jgi:maleamate amidohydrolase
MATAILIIDMLNDFFLEGRLKEHKEELCKNIMMLVDWGRANHCKIIWVRQEFKPDLSDAFITMRAKSIRKTIENTEGAQIVADLTRDMADVEVIKKRYSAFHKTSLDEILEKDNINRLVICGINTHACIRMAAIDAFQRDLDVIIAADCVDSYDKEHHDVSLRYLGKEISRVLTNDQIMALRSL